MEFVIFCLTYTQSMLHGEFDSQLVKVRRDHCENHRNGHSKYVIICIGLLLHFNTTVFSSKLLDAGMSGICLHSIANSDGKESASIEEPYAVFDLVKGLKPAYIVVARDEHPGVHAAIRDLQRDITKITGLTPNIVHSLKEADAKCIVIGSADCPEGKSLLESVTVSLDGLRDKWEMFSYVVLNDVGGKEQVLAIAGSSLRGSIFGIYDFEQKHLGVDPLWFWSDNEPRHRSEVVLDSRINYHSQKEPTWKYRGWTLNDHPQLIEWLESELVQRARYDRYMFVIHPEVFEHFYEAALRLKMNMFTWYFIDVDWKPDRQQLKAQVDRGLFITQHQMEGLGADAGFWNNYWDNHNPDGKPAEFSYLKHPDSFREFWTHYVKKLVEFSPHVVWELNQRGWADAAYTEPTLPSGGTGKQCAEILSAAIAEQAKLVRELDPNPDLEMMTTLYGELGGYYDSAWLAIPPGVTIGFGDRGMRGMAYSEKFWTEERDPDRKYGQYFHTQYFGGGPQIAKCTPIESYLKVNMDAMCERGDTQHMLLAINTLRHQQIEIRGIAEMLWDYPSFDPQEYQLRYCVEEFGSDVASQVSDLYDAYYAGYPHVIREDAFKSYPHYYKVMEPMFRIIGNLINIAAGNTDGWVLNYEYDEEVYLQGIKTLGVVLEQAQTLRKSISAGHVYFYDYEFIDAIRLIRGVYKLGLACNEAIAYLEKGDHRAAHRALVNAQPLTLELYEAFKHQKSGEKWEYWFRSATNKDFYLLFNSYQRARLHLETVIMNVVQHIEPERRPFRGNVVMNDPVKVGDAIYGSGAERLNTSTWNGAKFSVLKCPLEGAFQIGGIQSTAGKGDWVKQGTDYAKAYAFDLKTPSTVYVAVQKGIIPKWIGEIGFSSTGQHMEIGRWGWPYRYQHRDPEKVDTFTIFSRKYLPGRVQLGKNIDIDRRLDYSTRSTTTTPRHKYDEETNLPYVVFVRPHYLLWKNFREVPISDAPIDWDVTKGGAQISVVDIPDYDADLRPSVFDLTTSPRYTPLDLRGLEIRNIDISEQSFEAVHLFEEPSEAFECNVRMKVGQRDHRTGLELIDEAGRAVVEIVMNERGILCLQYGLDGVREICPYMPGEWYTITIIVHTVDGEFEVRVQDGKLETFSSGKIEAQQGLDKVAGIKLVHVGNGHGPWVLYDAISAHKY